jgi:hypothetical protein
MDESISIDSLQGFKVGGYMICFPPGEFVQEDDKGDMYVLVDIYKIDKDKAIKVNREGVPEELEEQINAEINRMLLAAIENEKGKSDDSV